MPGLSLIIPVYNRPGEVGELLESLVGQSDMDFEVLIVEDGSSLSCEEVIRPYEDRLDLHYFFKANEGPGPSRNYGSERARGDFLVFLDSDCVIPSDYVEAVKAGLEREGADAFGGPDRAHEGFTRFQKAINFSMTSFLTTGGIRGGTEKMGKFHPRSFNMGYNLEVFKATGGFSEMRFGEDVDLSLRIIEKGFKSILIKEAYVFHKRRSTLRQFFKQVHNSGIARINLYKRHPSSLKAVHFAPALFTLACFLLVLLSIFISPWFLVPLALHAFLLMLVSTIHNRCLRVGLLSIITSYTQLLAYGSGFIISFWRRLVLGRGEYAAFTRNFYK